jgi:hypothetical protein
MLHGEGGLSKHVFWTFSELGQLVLFSLQGTVIKRDGHSILTRPVDNPTASDRASSGTDGVYDEGDAVLDEVLLCNRCP